MTTKEYLKKIKSLDLKIRRDTVILKKLSDAVDEISIGAIRYDKDRVCSSMNGAGFTDRLIDIVDKQRTLQDSIFRLADERFHILEQINEMNDDELAEIIFKHYVEYKTLDEISEEMHLSYGTVRNMHGRALEDFRNKFLK